MFSKSSYQVDSQVWNFVINCKFLAEKKAPVIKGGDAVFPYLFTFVVKLFLKLLFAV